MAVGPEPEPERMSVQPWIPMVLGSLVILAGMAQVGMDEEFLPRFHFPLVTAAIGIPPVLLGLFAIGAQGKGPRVPFLFRHAGTVSAFFLVGALVTQSLLEHVRLEETFEMAWSPTVYKFGSEDRTGVRLEFVEHPGWTTEVVSKELADYLVARDARLVPVTIIVIRDFGILRKFKVVRVAERSDWTHGWMLDLVSDGKAVGPPPIR